LGGGSYHKKGKIMRYIEPSAELMSITPMAEKHIELCGRTCYRSEPDDARKFIKMILKRGHESVIEHAHATLRIITDRGIANEIVRHRLASYSQESTRYCNYGGQGISVLPPTSKVPIAVEDVLKAAERVYNEMIEAGDSPQVARDILPTCLKTEIIMTCNFREWRHFIKLRTSKAAHPKIRIIAKAILEILYGQAPSVFEDILED